MKIGISKIILGVEFAFIIFPISALFIIISSAIISSSIEYPDIDDLIILLFVLFNFVALLGVWFLAYRILYEKNESKKLDTLLKLFFSLGTLTCIIAWGSILLPESTPYTRMANIRDELELFSIGSPVLLVVFHLYHEKNANKI